jgi:hypothetical protein
MAHELRLTYTGSHSVYAILRKASNIAVWHATNTAWETWNDANIEHYDIPLASAGGYFYTATAPTDIDDDTLCLAVYCRREGASPAITDRILHAAEWTGTTAAAAAASSGAVLSDDFDLETTMDVYAITDTIDDYGATTQAAALVTGDILCHRQQLSGNERAYRGSLGLNVSHDIWCDPITTFTLTTKHKIYIGTIWYDIVGYEPNVCQQDHHDRIGVLERKHGATL